MDGQEAPQRQPAKKEPGPQQAAGEKRPAKVVVIHGMMGTAETAAEMASMMFRNAAPMPPGGVRTIAYDLIGRGSHPGSDDHGLDAYLAQLEAVVDLHVSGKEKVYLLGYSMGGAVALAYALRHPSRVHAVALLSPAGRVSSAGYLSTLGLPRVVWNFTVARSLEIQQKKDALRYTESKNVPEDMFERAVAVRERNVALISDDDFVDTLFKDIQQFPLHRLPLALEPGAPMPRTLFVSFTNDLIVSPDAVDALSSALERSLGDQARVVSVQRVPGCHITPLVQAEETGKRVAAFFFAKY